MRDRTTSLKLFSTQSFIGLYILLLILFNAQFILSESLSQAVKMISASHLDFSSRWTLHEGGNQAAGWIYTYSEFIKRHTPPTALVFIPPQTESWEQEGNSGYIRWFLYPRRLVQESLIIADIPDEAEYVMIAHGNWIWQANEFVWPRIIIPQNKIESITYINRATLEESTIFDTAYMPKFTEETWGIIKLKKNE